MTSAFHFSARGAPGGSVADGTPLAHLAAEGAGGGERPRSGAGGALPSFDQVYEAHFDFVWRSLRLLGVDDAALEDAAQDTFSIVSHKLAGFEGRSALRTWLFAILQRVAANYRRRRRRKQVPLMPLSEAIADEPTPLAHVEAAAAARAVERFCAELAPDRRALFMLVILEELPAAEVAATLGLPVAKVYSRVHALRDGLKRVLARENEDD